MWGSLSPDGTRVAVGEYLKAATWGGPPGNRFVIRRVDGKGGDLVPPLPEPNALHLSQSGCWSPDGRRIPVMFRLAEDPDGTDHLERTYLFDEQTGKVEPVPLPKWHYILDWSRDGKTFLIKASIAQDGQFVTRLGLIPVGGGEPTWLTPKSILPDMGRLSPDGTRLLYTASSNDPKEPVRTDQVYVMSLKDHKPIRVSDPDKGQAGLWCCWSPDGKRIAYVRQKLFQSDGKIEACNFAVVVANADGSNPRAVIAASAIGEDSHNVIKLGLCDWR